MSTLRASAICCWRVPVPLERRIAARIAASTVAHALKRSEYVISYPFPSGLSAAEEAGPEAAVLHGVELGFESDPVFREGRFLLREVHLFLEEAFALGLKCCFLLFEGRDRLLLQFALELDEVEAFDLGPEAVDLHPRRVALLADLFYLTGPLFQGGLFFVSPLPRRR